MEKGLPTRTLRVPLGSLHDSLSLPREACAPCILLLHTWSTFGYFLAQNIGGVGEETRKMWLRLGTKSTWQWSVPQDSIERLSVLKWLFFTLLPRFTIIIIYSVSCHSKQLSLSASKVHTVRTSVIIRRQNFVYESAKPVTLKLALNFSIITHQTKTMIMEKISPSVLDI